MSNLWIIDIGNGQFAQRHHLTKELLHEFDQASGALTQAQVNFSQAQANVRAWTRPLIAMQAAADVSGDILCTAPGQSGRIYTLNEVGAALLVDQRDVAVFSKLGFTDVPSGSAPTTGLRVGLVFLDTSLNAYMSWDGVTWSAVILT